MANCVGQSTESDMWRAEVESIVEGGNVNIGKETECASGNGGIDPCASMWTFCNGLAQTQKNNKSRT